MPSVFFTPPVLYVANVSASERMYKIRIKNWGLDKNCKASEMEYAYRLIHRRRRQGKKATIIKLRGRELPESEVMKYYR